MNREEAVSIVLAEAFAENGLAMLAVHGEDPGFQRMETLIAATNFLADDLAREDALNRALVSALFLLSTHVLDDLHCGRSPISDSRCSLFRQYNELIVAITGMIESWKHWPEDSELLTYNLEQPAGAAQTPVPVEEEFEGYRVGDITYAIVTHANDFFPVRVVRLGFNLIEVEPLFPDMLHNVCDSFLEDRHNRCFQAPSLPAGARFGGFDERPVNTARQSGPELRLLPAHYATTTGGAIRKRHADAPDRWPLPTGSVFERWFKDRE